MFRAFLAVFLCFSRVFTGVKRGKKILGVLGGFPWFLPKHQGMEDQGRSQRPLGRLFWRLFGVSGFGAL